MRVNATRKVVFEQPFRYSYAGSFHEANAIILCEPNFGHRTVHRKMQGLVGEAIRAFLAARAAKAPKQDAPANVEQSDEVAEKSAEEVAPEAEYDVDAAAREAIAMMQAYLAADRYGEFAEFVQKSLTGAVQLCYIETDDGKKITVREETWASIVDNGGMADLDRVLGAFTSFFTDPPDRSQKKNGSESPSISDAAATAASQ